MARKKRVYKKRVKKVVEKVKKAVKKVVEKVVKKVIKKPKKKSLNMALCKDCPHNVDIKLERIGQCQKYRGNGNKKDCALLPKHS